MQFLVRFGRTADSKKRPNEKFFNKKTLNCFYSAHIARNRRLKIISNPRRRRRNLNTVQGLNERIKKLKLIAYFKIIVIVRRCRLV